MIRIRQVKISVESDSMETLKKKISIKIKCRENDIKKIVIKKKSLDARRKPDLYYIYEVDVCLENEKEIIKRNKNNDDIFVSVKEEYHLPKLGDEKLDHFPIIVGSGPAGLFCAYILAEQGLKPIVLERGECVEKRIETVEHFWKTGQLNTESNVQFGEGGAGTFSDGKLNTLTKDKEFRCQKVFETFISCGADPEIMYLNNPHIGTDVLRCVVKNMREKIIKMGGTFLYNTCLTNLDIQDGKIASIEVNHQDKIPTDVLVLAIGHSARDTFEMLLEKGLLLEPKPFAIGIRIQHPQKLINQNQYGKQSANLPQANYKLTYKTKSGRGVYSFCMCPGGFVVNASSEKNRLAINGMSNHARDTENANSALVVTVNPKDYGDHPLDGMRYQRKLEEKAYEEGNGKIPVQTLKDFYQNKETKTIGNISPIFKGNYNFSDINKILPDFIGESLKEAIPAFGQKIKGFDCEDALLAAIETRTSSPVRIVRYEDLQSNIHGIYPCGEGAGYAGGITTSAMDGIKVAEKISNLYYIEKN